MFIPAIGGDFAIHANGKLIAEFSEDYSSTGPIIPIPETLAGSIHLSISVRFDGNEFYGLWLGPPLLGDLAELSRIRDRHIIRQEILPLAISAVLLLLSSLFLWIRHSEGWGDKRYKYIFFSLFAWSVFYFFLSGIPRHHLPFLGSALHIPIRNVAAVSILLLAASFLDPLPSVLRTCIIGSLPLVGILAVLNLRRQAIPSNIFYAAIHTLFLAVTITLLLQRRTRLQRIIAFLAAIASVGFVSDSLKLNSQTLGIEYHVPYLNRFTTPPLLLFSMIYLLHTFTERSRQARRTELYKRLAEQVDHDIRAPLAALTTVSQASDGLSQANRELLTHALDRVKSVVRTLSPDRQLASAKCTPLDFLKPIVSEHQTQNPRFPITLEISAGCREVLLPYASLEMMRAMSNLLQNAVEASKPDSPINVHVSRIRSILEIRIRDFGHGVPNEIKGRLFHRGATFGKAGGRGLGLSYVNELIRSQGGRVNFNSLRRGGSEFVLHLPIIGLEMMADTEIK